jgi:hypothetical protein
MEEYKSDIRIATDIVIKCSEDIDIPIRKDGVYACSSR